jgi:hypothetical protein
VKGVGVFKKAHGLETTKLGRTLRFSSLVFLRYPIGL